LRADERIEDLIKKSRHKTTAGTDERILSGACKALEEAIAQKGGRTGLKVSTVIGLWAAVIFVAAFLVFVGYMYKPAETADKQRRISRFVEAEQAGETKPQREVEIERKERLFESELQIAKKLFEDGDEDGLIRLLSQEGTGKQLAAVLYLARLGDAATMEKLDALSEQFGPDRPDNMYKIAIAAIENQLKKSRKAVNGTEQAKAAPDERYITGRLVDTDGNRIEGEIQLGGPRVKTGPDGSFSIKEPSYKEAWSNFGQAFSSDGRLGSFFYLDKGSDINDVEVVVERFASISGFVVDTNETVVDDVRLEPGVFVDEHLLSFERWSEPPWEISIEPGGAFTITSVPTGLPLQLAVTKPGFKTVVDLEDVAAGENLDLGQIVLRPLPGLERKMSWDCVLSGLVVDEANEPMAGVSITGSSFIAMPPATDGTIFHTPVMSLIISSRFRCFRRRMTGMAQRRRGFLSKGG